jgi:hypothetical protein
LLSPIFFLQVEVERWRINARLHYRINKLEKIIRDYPRAILLFLPDPRTDARIPTDRDWVLKSKRIATAHQRHQPVFSSPLHLMEQDSSLSKSLLFYITILMVWDGLSCEHREAGALFFRHILAPGGG